MRICSLCTADCTTLFLEDRHRSRHAEDVADLVANAAQLLESDSGRRGGPIGVVEQLERALRVRRRLGVGEQRLVQALGGVLANARHCAVAQQPCDLREQPRAHRAAARREQTGAPAQRSSSSSSSSSCASAAAHIALESSRMQSGVVRMRKQEKRVNRGYGIQVAEKKEFLRVAAAAEQLTAHRIELLECAPVS